MTETKITPAFSADALLGKSRVFIARALAAKARGSIAEYQLWASLALELLGKFALANFHPCLIADPQSAHSLFACAGISIGTDLKTIIAKTVFERLTHLSTRFDTKTKEFCDQISLRRNAELHSGEAPFEAMNPSSWEGRYWHTAEIILEVHKLTIEKWIGADEAKAQKELLTEYRHAISEAAKIRTETARETFRKRPKKEQQEALAKAQALNIWELGRLFRQLFDAIWETKCPACGSRAFLAGIKYAEEVSEEYDDEYSDEESVEAFYEAEDFRCPSCALHLDSRDEIEAAGLDTEHAETETRERQYEPDYGND
jgi:hypothetical protein